MAIALIVGGGIIARISDSIHTRQRAAAAASAAQSVTARRDSLKAFFAVNRDSILGSARDLWRSGSLDAAIARLVPFQAFADSSLNALRDSIRESQIIDQLKSVPNSNAAGNATLYGELAKLRPENTSYQAKAKSFAATRDREQARAQAAKAVQDRRAYAQTLESALLDKWMNVTVTTKGSQATTLVLKYILVDKVWAHNMSQNAEMFANFRRLGFQRFEITDGYDENWYWDLK